MYACCCPFMGAPSLAIVSYTKLLGVPYEVQNFLDLSVHDSRSQKPLDAHVLGALV